MITTIENDTLSLLFGSPWPLEDHAHFVRSKALPEAEIKYDESADTYEVRAPARFAPLMGLEMPVPCRSPLPLPDFLFDYQAWITRMAVEAKRFAVWADCGLGKTPIQLEWARQVHHLTGGARPHHGSARRHSADHRGDGEILPPASAHLPGHPPVPHHNPRGSGRLVQGGPGAVCHRQPRKDDRRRSPGNALARRHRSGRKLAPEDRRRRDQMEPHQVVSGD
ncbi:hypothetical protein Ga0100230_004225 [Opitutaceae bacterium TAV3]|nr:hypothetical protein Ga0100230_004225 [Opitutaceae bacterium TAV3]